MGTWDWDVHTGLMWWDERIACPFCLSSWKLQGELRGLFGLIHEEDREAFARNSRTRLRGALLICAPLDRLEADVERMRQCMVEASRFVLDGFEIRTEAKLIRYPDHYSDPRGERMWREVTALLCQNP